MRSADWRVKRDGSHSGLTTGTLGGLVSGNLSLPVKRGLEEELGQPPHVSKLEASHEMGKSMGCDLAQKEAQSNKVRRWPEAQQELT